MFEFHPYLPGILAAYAAFLVGAASPGPNTLAIMGTSMSVSRRAGLALAVGVASGSFLWSVLTMLGVTALIAAHSAALTGFKIAGGLYLLWLSWKALRSAMSDRDLDARVPEAGMRAPIRFFLRGLTVQMSNPKAALIWVAIISLGLSPGAPPWVGVTIIAGTFVLSLGVHAGYALAFSTRPMVAAYRRLRRGIQFALGAFFGSAGLALLGSRM